MQRKLTINTFHTDEDFENSWQAYWNDLKETDPTVKAEDVLQQIHAGTQELDATPVITPKEKIIYQAGNKTPQDDAATPLAKTPTTPRATTPREDIHEFFGGDLTPKQPTSPPLPRPKRSLGTAEILKKIFKDYESIKQQYIAESPMTPVQTQPNISTNKQSVMQKDVPSTPLKETWALNEGSTTPTVSSLKRPGSF